MQRVLYAKKFKIDIIIGITADCPLIDPDIIILVLILLKKMTVII